LVGPDAEKKSFMHALFLRNLTINPLILKVFALTKVGETSGARVRMGSMDHDNLPRPHPGHPGVLLKGRERVFVREVL
jgi:hypothetical protein